jgi:large subunit ribosomal protein L31
MGVYQLSTRKIQIKRCTMKQDTHPDYHLVKIIMTDGTEYFTKSTWGTEGDTMNLDIDPTSHPAWTSGSQTLIDRGGRLSGFKARFGALGQAKS